MSAPLKSFPHDLLRIRPDLIDPASTALFVDIDGTLLDMAPTPSAVSIPTQLVDLLIETHGLFHGAVAILTGRQILDADKLLYPLRLVASGVHGCQFRSEMEGPVIEDVTGVAPDLLAALFALSESIPGVVIEPKGAGIAVHYRRVPWRRLEIESCVRGLVVRQGAKLVVSLGRMVIEIIPAGHSKGTALKAILALPPFRGRRPVMIGDDVGDEPAFAVAIESGGAAFKVAGEHFDRGEADFGGPVAVREWLRDLIDGNADRSR